VCTSIVVRMCVCVCVRERVCVCVRERERESVCVSGDVGQGCGVSYICVDECVHVYW